MVEILPTGVISSQIPSVAKYLLNSPSSSHYHHKKESPVLSTKFSFSPKKGSFLQLTNNFHVIPYTNFIIDVVIAAVSYFFKVHALFTHMPCVIPILVLYLYFIYYLYVICYLCVIFIFLYVQYSRNVVVSQGNPV